jgi:hypothetical protein
LTKARSRGQLRPVIPVRQAPVFALLCLLPYATSASDPDPIYLTANDLSIATGKPSLVRMSSVSTHIPVWSLSGGTVGQSVSGVTGLPRSCVAVKIEIVVTSTNPQTSSEYTDLYRVHLSQMVEGAPFTAWYRLGKPVRTKLPGDSFTRPTGLALVKVRP